MTYARNPRNSRRRGISLVEVAAGLAIMGVVGVTTMHFVGEQTQAQRAMTAAATLGTVRDATQDFLRANYQALLSANPVGGAPTVVEVARTTAGATIPPGSLQANGFLPAVMIDRNTYAQNHSVLVRQTLPGTLEALVIQTGGSAIRDSDLGRIVQRLGSNGGARFATVTNPSLATVVQGNSGAWSANAAAWTAGSVSPQTGRAAALANFGSAAMLSDYLNRYNVSIPEANTMRTALNMGTNDINAVGIVNAQSAQLQNGGNACASNAVGCTLWFGSQNGMVSYADGWLRLQGQTAGAGLSLEGAGNNLYVGGRTDVVGDIATQGTIWAQNGARIGRDTSGNPTGAGFLDISGNAFVSGAVAIGQDPVTGLPTGLGALAVQGPGTFTGDIRTFTNLYANGNASIGGNITTPNSVFAGYVRSSGSIDAGNDINAGNSVNAVANITAGGTVQGSYVRSLGNMDAVGNITSSVGNVAATVGRVIGGGGVHTLLSASVGQGCDVGMIAVNAATNGMLFCRNGTYVVPGSPNLGATYIRSLPFGTLNMVCGTNEVMVGMIWEPLTWTATPDEHSAPESQMLCAPVN